MIPNGVKNAYALLGLSFLIVLGGAYLLYERAYAPTQGDLPLEAPDRSSSMALTLTSPAFQEHTPIPRKYTCDGENINPPLTIDGVPEGTDSFVLVMDDPDIPQEVKDSRGIESFDHWVVYNIPGDTREIPEGATLGTEGLNSGGDLGYRGACPPPQYEPTEHRYVFRLYAITGQLNFAQTPTLDEVEEAAKGSAIENAQLIGTYDRSN